MNRVTHVVQYNFDHSKNKNKGRYIVSITLKKNFYKNKEYIDWQTFNVFCNYFKLCNFKFPLLMPIWLHSSSLYNFMWEQSGALMYWMNVHNKSRTIARTKCVLSVIHQRDTEPKTKSVGRHWYNDLFRAMQYLQATKTMKLHNTQLHARRDRDLLMASFIHNNVIIMIVYCPRASHANVISTAILIC